MEQETLPQVPNHSFQILSEQEIAAVRKKLIESQGDMEAANIDLATMRNVIYTCRMKANPMQDTPSPKESKVKKEKTPSINQKVVVGNAVDNFLE